MSEHLRLQLKMITRVVAAGIATAAFSMGSASLAQENAKDAPKLEEVSVVLVTTSLAAAPVLAAISANTFRQHGLKINYYNIGGASTSTVATVLSGKAVFGTAGGSIAIDAIRAGVPIQLIANIERPNPTIAVRKEIAAQIEKTLGVTPRSSMPDRVRALKGLKIAATPAGGPNTTILRAMLQQYGVDPDKDVTLLPSSQTTVVAGLKAGKFDAAQWGLGTLEKNIQDGDAVEWISFARNEVPEVQDFVYMVAFTKIDTIKEHPKLVEAFVESLRDGAKLYAEKPESAIPGIKKEFFATLDEELWQRTWKLAQPGIISGLRFTRKAIANTIDIQTRILGRNYEGITYERFVADMAQTR